jgi:putative endonuclease
VYLYYVYMITNRKHGTIYTGVSSNLYHRMYQHKHKLIKGFSSRYNLTQLVYFETTRDIRAAITREKQIKGWVRKKKIALIESVNPEWNDLSKEWFD